MVAPARWPRPRSRPRCGRALPPRARRALAGRRPGRAVGQGAPSCRSPTRPCWPNRCLRAEDAGRRPRGPRGARRQGAARRYPGAHPAAPGGRDLAGPRHERCGAQRLCPMARCKPGQEVHVTLVPSVVRANRDGARALQRVRRGPGPQGDGDAQRRRRVRGQRLAHRRAHRSAPSSSTTTSRRPRASTPACTTPPSGRASRPTSSCRSSRSTPTRPIFASACAPATASSSSSTSRTRTKARTAAWASCSPPPSPRPARRTSSTASALPTGSSTTTTSRATPRASS